MARRAVAEALGTLFLLAAVVGSGIMGERLAGGNVAIALVANTIATGAALVALILTFGPISGAHFNPAVTLADATQGGVAWRDVPVYIAAQIVGAFSGVAAAHLMFGSISGAHFNPAMRTAKRRSPSHSVSERKLRCAPYRSLSSSTLPNCRRAAEPASVADIPCRINRSLRSCR